MNICFVCFFQKRLKHKLDGNLDTQNQTQGQSHPDNVYRFDDDEPTAKKPTPSNSANIDGQLSSVSVHIVHEYNGNSQQKPQISTNVTVNSTIKPPNSQETDVKTNVECKQEPFDDSASKGSNQSKTSQNSNADIDSDIDIPTNFDNEDDIFNIIDELEKFDEIYRRKVQDSETNESSLNSSSEKGSMFSPEMYVDPSQAHSQVRTQPMQPYRATAAGQPHVPVSTMSEGGLAAETLKQMAAQHQQHHPGQEQFGVKSAIDPFSDMPNTGQFNQRNGYPSEYQYNSNGQRPASGGAYNGQQCLGYPNKPSVPAYGVTKPLTHYSHTQSESGPSSLQQLQNQVAHFNHGPQMEITQTQHMQLSDGSHRMQMSQTQQIQLRQPVHNISLTQQQAFSASPNMGQTQSQNFMTNEQLAMQQQMMQSKLHNDQRQQAASASHMQQYMNRPPPEYKMQHANGMSSGMSASSIGTNPLQTIQNMVNQTNTHSNQGYSNVKSESSDLHMQNGLRTAQMSAMQQQMSNSANPSVGMSMAQAQMQYSNQAVQRQASFPGAMAQAQARGQRPNTPTYTSAIMRNQRPPNVNIGPDGLNISQPRTHDWPGPRGMMPASGQRGVSPSTSAGMLQYRSFSAEGQNVNSAAAAAEIRMQQQQQSNVQMSALQSQQAVMMQGNAQAQQQMMMQQQRLQMSHQMARPHSSQSPSYNMTTPPATSFPQASASQEDILNLLDTAPNQSTDFFDVQTSGSGTEANWYDIDDILGNPK